MFQNHREFHGSHFLGQILVSILIYLPNPSTRVGYDTKSICMRSLTGLNSKVFLLLDQLPYQD